MKEKEKEFANNVELKKIKKEIQVARENSSSSKEKKKNENFLKTIKRIMMYFGFDSESHELWNEFDWFWQEKSRQNKKKN